MADATQRAIALLFAYAAAFRQHYAPGVADYLKRHGKTTRAIPTKKRRAQGTSIEYTIKAWHNRGTNVSMDPMSDQPGHTPGKYVTVKPNFDYTGGTNHFAKFECAFTTNIYDLLKRGDDTFKDGADFVRKDVEEGLASVREDFAKYLHLDNNGLLGTLIGGTSTSLKDDDSDSYFSAGDYTAGRTTAMARLNPAAIARIGDGQVVDLYQAGTATVVLKNVRVTYVHPYEESVSLSSINKGTADGVAASAGLQETHDGANPPLVQTDLGALATQLDTTNVDVFLAGSRGAAPHGTLARLFDVSQAYFDKVRRSDDGGYAAENAMLRPIRVDPSENGADVPLTADLFRRVGEVAGWQQGGFSETASMMMVMSRYEYRQVADFVKDEGITMLPALESDVGKGLNKAFGFDGFILHDPTLGSQMITVDDFAEPGKIDFLNRGQWEQLSPLDEDFMMMPGSIAGIWNRNNQLGSVAAAGNPGTLSSIPGKTYSANGFQLVTWFCTWPKGQIRLDNLLVTR